MTLLAVQSLTRVYPVRIGLRRAVPLFAVSDVSFMLAEGAYARRRWRERLREIDAGSHGHAA